MMKKQIDRLLFHMNMSILSPLQVKLFPPCSEEDETLDEALTEEERNEADELLDYEDEKYVRLEPVLEPQNTMLFGGGPCKKKLNFLNVDHYRTEICKAYAWANLHGINVFLADYTTPIGLLALETLLDLRRSGKEFHLYSIQTVPVKCRKTYRLIRETEIEMIGMITACDYRYNRLTILDLFDKILSKVGYHYNEDGIEIMKGWDDKA